MIGWGSRLDALPRLSLAAQLTPLICAERLSAAFGGPQVWFKRDDLLPSAFGGNKVRSLDFVVADALRQGADTLVTGAGPLSNHVRASAGVAALTGLRSVAVYWGSAPTRVDGNHRLTKMLGADIRFTGDPDRASVDRALEMTVAEIAARGGRPYVIPRGGACALATVAHVLAVRETLTQCADLGIAPRIIVMAVGGGATFAGWLLGSALFGASWRIEGITVSRSAQEALTRAKTLAADAAAIIDCPSDFNDVEFNVHDGFIGDGYGLLSPEGKEAIVTVARAEGVFLDPVYTGKAMAGYRALLSQGRCEGVDAVLFLHTGGAPTLFTPAMEAST